jgi:hypothetical protein
MASRTGTIILFLFLFTQCVYCTLWCRKCICQASRITCTSTGIGDLRGLRGALPGRYHIVVVTIEQLKELEWLRGYFPIIEVEGDPLTSTSLSTSSWITVITTQVHMTSDITWADTRPVRGKGHQWLLPMIGGLGCIVILACIALLVYCIRKYRRGIFVHNHQRMLDNIGDDMIQMTLFRPDHRET